MTADSHTEKKNKTAPDNTPDALSVQPPNEQSDLINRIGVLECTVTMLQGQILHVEGQLMQLQAQQTSSGFQSCPRV